MKPFHFESAFKMEKSFFDNSLITPGSFTNYRQKISRYSPHLPHDFSTISAPFPHIIAENLRRRCGNRAEMVRKTPSYYSECRVCVFSCSGSHLFM